MALRTFSRAVLKSVSEKLLMGICLPTLHSKAVRVQVTVLEFDDYVKMHFPQTHIFFAHDPKTMCKSGDVVIIRQLPKPLSKIITHEVSEIAYYMGDTIDPVTGEKCVGSRTRNEIEREAEILGRNKLAIDYSKAPKRGWQEGKKDLSDKITYVKYHVFKETEEESNDPYAI